MNDTSIACFLSVARTGSFTTSAKELCSTQQAVSRNVQNLEEELGFPLLDRNGHTVDLTWEGSRFHTWCLEYDRQIALAVEATERLVGKDRNTLRLGWCDWTGCPDELTEDIRAFSAQYSDCSMDYYQAPVDEINTMLTEGRLDLAILPEYCTHNLSGIIVSAPIMQQELFAVTGTRYRFSGERPSLQELTPMKCLCPHFGSDTDDDVRGRILSMCSRLGIFPENMEIKPNVRSTFSELSCGPCYTISPKTTYANRRDDLYFHPLDASIPLVFTRPNDKSTPWVPLFEAMVRQRRMET